MTPLRFVLLLAAVLTVATAVKPLHIDDTYAYERAKRIVEEPLDPSGFEVYWRQWPQPGTESPWPLLIPYWLAGGIAISGDHPWVWKLWFFPFHCIFVWALYSVFRRFVGWRSRLLTVAAALSPTLLPGWNLMLDLPTLGLILTAVCLFARAIDHDDIRLAIAAGIASGAASQSKYNGLVAFGIVLLYAVLNRRLGWGLVSTAVGSALFWGWELWLWSLYGESQFLWALRASFPGKWSKFELATALAPILGATLSWAALLPVATSRRALALTIGGATALVAALGSLAWRPHEPLVLTLVGIALFCALAVSIWRLAKPIKLRDLERHRTSIFLFAWLGLELATYFAVSPFGAVRRTQGLAIVTLLLIGRALAKTQPEPCIRAVRVAAACGIALGLGYQGLDLYEARVSRTAARESATLALSPGGEGWYTGHWGFAFYAESEGLSPIVPDHSEIGHRDRIVVPQTVARQRIDEADPDFELVQELYWDDALRLTTMGGYYSGRYPIRHRSGPRFVTKIYEARQGLTPRTPWSANFMAQWLRDYQHWASSSRAFPRVEQFLREGDRSTRVKIARALRDCGPTVSALAPAVADLLGEASPAAQIAALEALGALGNDDPNIVQKIEASTRHPREDIRTAATAALVELRVTQPAL